MIHRVTQGQDKDIQPKVNSDNTNLSSRRTRLQGHFIYITRAIASTNQLISIVLNKDYILPTFEESQFQCNLISIWKSPLESQFKLFHPKTFQQTILKINLGWIGLSAMQRYCLQLWRSFHWISSTASMMKHFKEGWHVMNLVT